MFAGLGLEQPSRLTLYTDALIIRGLIRTRQHRITDILNSADDPYLVLEDVTTEEFGSRASAERADYAQINLDAVLFAVSDTEVDAVAELRTPKSAEKAIISIPPFKLSGSIHVLPGRDMREALQELQGKFLPLTDVTYWSDTVAEPRTSVHVVAFNHRRAQIMAPHKEVDPWAGMGGGASQGGSTEGGATGGEAPTGDTWTQGDPGTTTGW
jgi:hypothetical protein